MAHLYRSIKCPWALRGNATPLNDGSANSLGKNCPCQSKGVYKGEALGKHLRFSEALVVLVNDSFMKGNIGRRGISGLAL